jgi:hypothetical protein
MSSAMNYISPSWEPRRVGPVEPDLLATALFLFSEYLDRLMQALTETDAFDDAGEEGDEGGGTEIDTRAVLDLFAEELGTDVTTTLNLYMRVTALFELFSANPGLAGIALEDAGSQTLTEDALVAAARLDLRVERFGSDGRACFDPREFRKALEEE